MGGRKERSRERRTEKVFLPSSWPCCSPEGRRGHDGTQWLGHWLDRVLLLKPYLTQKSAPEYSCIHVPRNAQTVSLRSLANVYLAIQLNYKYDRRFWMRTSCLIVVYVVTNAVFAAHGNYAICLLFIQNISYCCWKCKFQMSRLLCFNGK